MSDSNENLKELIDAATEMLVADQSAALEMQKKNTSRNVDILRRKFRARARLWVAVASCKVSNADLDRALRGNA